MIVGSFLSLLQLPGHFYKSHVTLSHRKKMWNMLGCCWNFDFFCNLMAVGTKIAIFQPHFFLSRLCFTFVCISQVVVSGANVSFAFPQLAYLLSQFQCFVCPVGFNSESNSFTVECEPSDIFVMQEYTLPTVLQNTLTWVRLCSCLSLGVIIMTTLRDFRMNSKV